MPLKGIKVLEFVGLAPGPFCGKILSDFGASVLRIDKLAENHLDVLQDGKATIGLNLKNERSNAFVKRLVKKSDVLIEPFRPGVMERLNLGPEVLCKEQPSLIYARLTGFGQQGPLASRAGHDINYVALSGILSMLGKPNENPSPPINLLADFAGGGLMCAFGICLALLERYHSGCGQVVDSAMIDGCAYIGSFLYGSRSLPYWGKSRGKNILDGGAYFYNTYETKDNKFMSVGALEPQFFEEFKKKLNLPNLNQYLTDDKEIAQAQQEVAAVFLQKTQEEWSKIFDDTDSCVYPIVDWDKVMSYNHNKERKAFECIKDEIWPKPAPILSRTPGHLKISGSHENKRSKTLDFLMDLGFKTYELESLEKDKILYLPKLQAHL